MTEPAVRLASSLLLMTLLSAAAVRSADELDVLLEALGVPVLLRSQPVMASAPKPIDADTSRLNCFFIAVSFVEDDFPRTAAGRRRRGRVFQIANGTPGHRE